MLEIIFAYLGTSLQLSLDCLAAVCIEADRRGVPLSTLESRVELYMTRHVAPLSLAWLAMEQCVEAGWDGVRFSLRIARKIRVVDKAMSSLTALTWPLPGWARLMLQGLTTPGAGGSPCPLPLHYCFLLTFLFKTPTKERLMEKQVRCSETA